MAGGTQGSEAGKTPAEEPPPPPTIPKVHLLEADRETCLVVVGDAMPEAELADLAGEKQALAGLRGEKLTLVFFWTSGDSEFSAMRAQAALEDLQKDVHEPYAEKGVGVVAVNEGDTAESVKKLVDEAAAAFPNLLDTDGTLFAKVATKNLTRPYLLDAEGKILWFDLEYSSTTRDNLMQAIQVALGELK
jgi:peroxiredoxin